MEKRGPDGTAHLIGVHFDVVSYCLAIVAGESIRHLIIEHICTSELTRLPFGALLRRDCFDSLLLHLHRPCAQPLADVVDALLLVDRDIVGITPFT